MNLVAQIAEHFGRAAFPDPHVDGALIETRLGRREAGHWGQEADLDGLGLIRHRHAFGVLLRRQPQWPAVERLVVGIVELEAARPVTALSNAFDNDVYPYVARLRFTMHPAYVAYMKFAPQEIGFGHGQGDEITAVDRNARAFLRRTFAPPLLVPTLDANVPQGERLHRRSLTRVVGADEYYGTSQLDLDVVESLEVSQGESGKQGAVLSVLD